MDEPSPADDTLLDEEPVVFEVVANGSKRGGPDQMDIPMVSRSPPTVEAFMVDFEQGAWQAIRESFPGSRIVGCVFHWTRAIWRHIQDLGLVPTYRRRETTHTFLQQILALPFLPQADIHVVFDSLKQRATLDVLSSLGDYVDRQWMNHAVFDFASWSVFRLFLLSQYADDTTFILPEDPTILNEILLVLESFAASSGLKVNIDKTEVVWIGAKRGCGEELLPEKVLAWNHRGKFKLLGVKYNSPKRMSTRKTMRKN